MATRARHAVPQIWHALGDDAAGAADGQLLARFADGRDSAGSAVGL